MPNKTSALEWLRIAYHDLLSATILRVFQRRPLSESLLQLTPTRRDQRGFGFYECSFRESLCRVGYCYRRDKSDMNNDKRGTHG